MSDIIEAPEAPRVLVVDDEPQILMIMRFTLETAGFVVVCAADGAQAWSLFKQQSFDLVVLDLMIPTAYRVRRALGEEGRRYIHLVRGEGYTMPRLERSTLGGTPSTSTEPEQVAPHPITVTHHGNGDVTKPTVTDHHPAGPHHQE